MCLSVCLSVRASKPTKLFNGSPIGLFMSVRLISIFDDVTAAMLALRVADTRVWQAYRPASGLTAHFDHLQQPPVVGRGTVLFLFYD